jgi:ribonuclease Z
MEPFKVHILGCGSALPTSKHNASSQVVEIREKLFMIDCGEGTQVQLRRSRIRFTKISCVFISHLHGDHCFGLMGLISTFGLLGRTSTLRVYAPRELEEILKAQMQLFCNGLDFKVEFHAVDTTVSKVIYEDRSLTVTTLPLDHRIACCGFLFREKQGLPHIRRDMLDCYDIPLSQVNNIKNGADWTTVDGEVIPHTLLTTPADSPRSYAYCSDTRYMPQLYRLLEGVDTLYHESTYGNENVERARLYYHSTAAQAAQVARDAKVKKLILGHYSARYDDEKTLLKEAMQIFPNCLLGNEGMTINVE